MYGNPVTPASAAAGAPPAEVRSAARIWPYWASAGGVWPASLPPPVGAAVPGSSSPAVFGSTYVFPPGTQAPTQRPLTLTEEVARYRPPGDRSGTNAREPCRDAWLTRGDVGTSLLVGIAVGIVCAVQRPSYVLEPLPSSSSSSATLSSSSSPSAPSSSSSSPSVPGGPTLSKEERSIDPVALARVALAASAVTLVALTGSRIFF